MMRIWALARREFWSCFLSPVGYVVIGFFLAVTGFVFMRGFDAGKPASMRSVFELGMWMLLFVCPAITMRAVSEERRMGTLEMLMTCPVRDGEVILGKYLGALLFLGVMLLCTGPQVALLEWYGRPDYGEVLCGYLGLFLAGAVYLAGGMLASAMTSSQVVAFLVTFFFWLGLSLGTKFLPGLLPEPWSTAAYAADPDPRLRDFAIGLIDTSNIAYFGSLIVLFLVLAGRALEARRWP